MSTTKIKICGLRRLEDATYVNNFKPDYVGFVFAKSKRQVTKELAEKLKNELDPAIIRVGVFVNQPLDWVADLVNRDIISYVQLHGDEDQKYITKLRSSISNNVIGADRDMKTGIIKAVRVKEELDIDRANSYDCDYILLDTYSVECEGGNGKTFDWSMIKKMKKPFFLAGGINEMNVLQAIQMVRPYGVDASSGLETDGYKDVGKIRNFVEKIREYTEK
ncbi:MAG TPA: N-(5'-phosphoribosyl)anthranilate isomerase [Lachnospiraceae bacterium]|uniref:phosphoribosylanthranilate isomerase n=1 Tax=Anaerosporobacter sp. TaxID=1872529 RepID=UPI000EC82FCC|nr:phosphoribosylanthranilate isomerase [Anaerosporobacter sp.]HAB61220.1 N-(5'-phosphoribosyl)anthranilate isomerase [Lachnospiraceae bacterium]